VLKGRYTALRYFQEPGARPSADIDLLVSGDQIGRARRALQDIGLIELQSGHGQTQWGSPSSGQAVRSLELEHAANPWTVDLHTSIDRQYSRGLRAGFGDLPLTATRAWEVDGCRARVLAQPLLAAHLAQHASQRIRQVRLIHLVELVLVLQQDTANGTLSWDAFASLLAVTDTARFGYPALELAERLAPGTLDRDFRDAITAASTARIRRVVDRVDRSPVDGFFRRYLGEKVMWARGPYELTASLVDLLWPSKGSVADRWRMYRWRVRRLWRRW
jgi:hypothetical protein